MKFKSHLIYGGCTEVDLNQRITYVKWTPSRNDKRYRLDYCLPTSKSGVNILRKNEESRRSVEESGYDTVSRLG